MNIAVIGWGSLIWKPEGNDPPGTQLQIQGPWYKKGPLLPVEFARQSTGKRLTLVICENLPPQPTLWARCSFTDLSKVIGNLRKREGTSKEDIHYVKASGESWPDKGFDVDILQRWLTERAGIDAAVWTGLPPKFSGQERVPSHEEAIAYLQGLGGKDAEGAQDYIRRTPEMIRTTIRKVVEDRLGWMPIPLPEGMVADDQSIH